MRSVQPKVTHRIMGRPLVNFPIALAERLGCGRTVVVVGHGREAVEEAVRGQGAGEVVFALQAEQRGTGDAVRAALPKLRGHKGCVLILSGDVPLVDAPTVRKLKKAFDRTTGPLAFISFVPDNPKGYGRVIREKNTPVAIREHGDASAAEKKIGEVNAGIYLIEIGFLRRAVRHLDADNRQGELYLTDLVAMAAKRGGAPAVVVDEKVVRGVNDRADLAAVEAVLSARRNLELMRAGVTLRHPETIHVDLTVKVGRDTELLPGVHLYGQTTIGSGCAIGNGTIIIDSEIENDVTIKPYSVIESARLESRAEVGPMARLRPGAVVGQGAKIGNWVEVKNTVVGKGSKANHLAYLGDGVIGERVNVGAGTIFCNYDGFMKHTTVLGDDVFIGSDSQLVAPVQVGSGAYVASGSTVTRDVPPDDLAISRVSQENRPGTAKRLKERLKKMKAARLKARR
jgi:bifunctional UDP-N-acetylglucosamine pyrophosphorylase/glucosamine-1-phosphate N-acetyltransferase